MGNDREYRLITQRQQGFVIVLAAALVPANIVAQTSGESAPKATAQTTTVTASATNATVPTPTVTVSVPTAKAKTTAAYSHASAATAQSTTVSAPASPATATTTIVSAPAASAQTTTVSQPATVAIARATTVSAAATQATTVTASAPKNAVQTAAVSAPITQLATVVVIGATPVQGVGINIDKIPGNAQSLSTAALSLEGSASIITALNNQLSSININDNLGNPFQPDILYRGFEASPVLGTPQGLSVYQNGVRINEAFGDTVNWDFFPDVAISRIDIVSANPVYGLNTLGGSIVLTMKNGFNYQGGQTELLAGSYGHGAGNVQYGANKNHFGIYFSARYLHDDGWRDFSPTTLRQLYTDLSYHTDKWILDLSFTQANNNINGEGTTPIQELAVDRSLVFTTPQVNHNSVNFVTFNGEYKASPVLSIQGNLYYRAFRQSVLNGDTTEYQPCTTSPNIGYLCQSDGVTPLTNARGERIADISNGGAVPIGQNDSELIFSHTAGGSLQTSTTAKICNHENLFSVGLTLDRSGTNFGSATELGTINSALVVSNSGLFVVTPENTPFNATPVLMDATNTYYGLYATDTFNVTPALAVTASGRYNMAAIDLRDHLGTNLTGDDDYKRFNPAIGFTYKIIPTMTVYAGFAEGSRAPTPSELLCSDPLRPCLLPSSLSSDPPLKMVVSNTLEAGLRGSSAVPQLGKGQLTWNVGLYRTNVIDDIYAIATSLSAGYFANVGETRREGIDMGMSYATTALTAYANYSYINASFQSPMTMPSPSNPFQNAAGEVFVLPGDKIPGIPTNRFKIGLDYHPAPWEVGINAVYASSQFYRGDESNQMGPLAGYVVVNLHANYWINPNMELFSTFNNVLNAKYATFGTLGDPTGIGAPGIPVDAVTNGPGVNNRYQGPAAPFTAYAGVRLKC